jgi:hypothetical protein
VVDSVQYLIDGALICTLDDAVSLIRFEVDFTYTTVSSDVGDMI